MNKTPWYQKYFEDKKITVMGLGLLGRGVGDTKFLAENNARLTVTDLKDEFDLESSVKKLSKFSAIDYVLGRHRKSEFKNTDYVLKASGVPLKNDYIDVAKNSGAEIKMSAAWMIEILREAGIDVTVIGVTGTKGKSTVTGMMEAVLRECGARYHLAGNVRGVANLPLLKRIRSGDFIIMELDSWQLQGFREAKISPDIGIFTNFFPDHMDYYKGSMKKYFTDKSAIFRNQTGNQICFMPQLMKKNITDYGRATDKKKQIEFIAPKDILEIKLIAPGIHNRENATLVYHAARKIGFRSSSIKKGLREFSPVEGRLQDLGIFKGVRFINDNNSTTPESTMLTLESVAAQYPKSSIIWFGGGSDKLCNYKKLGKAVPKLARYSVLFSGKGTDKIIQCLPNSYLSAASQVEHMKQAFKTLSGLTNKGDIVVFSPAAASFGLFENEYDRNDQFLREVKKFKR